MDAIATYFNKVNTKNSEDIILVIAISHRSGSHTEDKDEKKSILKDTNRLSLLLRKARKRDEKEENDKT